MVPRGFIFCGGSQLVQIDWFKMVWFGWLHAISVQMLIQVEKVIAEDMASLLFKADKVNGRGQEVCIVYKVGIIQVRKVIVNTAINLLFKLVQG